MQMVFSIINSHQFHPQGSEEPAESDRTDETETMSWGHTPNKHNGKDDASDGDISSIIMDPVPGTSNTSSKDNNKESPSTSDSSKKKGAQRLTWFDKSINNRDKKLKGKQVSESVLLARNKQDALAAESARTIEELRMKLHQRTDAIKNLESALSIQTEKIEMLTNQLQQQKEREEEAIREGVKEAIGKIYEAQVANLRHVVTKDLGLTHAELAEAVNDDYDEQMTAPLSSLSPQPDRFDRPPPSYLSSGREASTNRHGGDGDGDDDDDDYYDNGHNDGDSTTSWSSPKSTNEYDNDDAYHSSERHGAITEEEFSVASGNIDVDVHDNDQQQYHDRRYAQRSSIKVEDLKAYHRNSESSKLTGQQDRSSASVRDTDDDLEAFAEFSSRWDFGSSTHTEDTTYGIVHSQNENKKSLNHKSEHVRRTRFYENDDDGYNGDESRNTGFGFKRHLNSTNHSR